MIKIQLRKSGMFESHRQKHDGCCFMVENTKTPEFSEMTLRLSETRNPVYKCSFGKFIKWLFSQALTLQSLSGCRK